MGKQIIFVISVAVLSTLIFQNLVFAKSENAKERRVLTAEEVELANEARAEAARVVEKNLVRFFTLVLSADENGVNRMVHQRQDEDDNEESVPTLDPTILPQVSQILAAVFSGGLNITNVIDRTFSLVPASLKDQVKGLFRLLTGQKPIPTTVAPAKQKQKVATTQSSQKLAETTPKYAEVEITTVTNSLSKSPIRYKINRRNRTTPVPNSTNALVLLPDDENETIFRLEEKLVQAAIEAEPSVRNKEPRQFRGLFSSIMNRIETGNLNFTQIVKFVPDLFKGATSALKIIENVGEIVGGADVDDVDDVDDIDF